MKGEFALADALQGLVHLRGIDLALDDVEDRDVLRLAEVLARRATTMMFFVWSRATITSNTDVLRELVGERPRSVSIVSGVYPVIKK